MGYFTHCFHGVVFTNVLSQAQKLRDFQPVYCCEACSSLVQLFVTFRYLLTDTFIQQLGHVHKEFISLVPRPSPAPVFDHLQYAQKRREKAW